MNLKEKLGTGAYFIAGLLFGISPFIKGFLYDWGLMENYVPITTDGWKRAAVGFFFVFGAKYFNTVSAAFGGAIKEVTNRFINKKDTKDVQ